MRQTKEINDPKCTLSDKELVEKVNSIILKLCKTGGKSWSLRVPVDFNNDLDMLIIEMGKRLLSPNSNVLESSLKPFTGGMHVYLLVNALKCLTEEQMASLCFDLYSRSSLKSEIKSKIEVLEDKKLYTEQNMLDLLQVCKEAMVIGTSVFVDRKAKEFIKSLTTENGK